MSSHRHFPPAEKPPHPATVAQPKVVLGAAPRPPHPATVAQPKAVLGAAPRPPHPATVAQPRFIQGPSTVQRAKTVWGTKTLVFAPPPPKTYTELEKTLRAAVQQVLSDKNAWKLSASDRDILNSVWADTEKGTILPGNKTYYEGRITLAKNGLQRTEAEVALEKIHNHFFSTVTTIGSGTPKTNLLRVLGTDHSVGVMYVKKEHARRELLLRPR